MAPFPARSPPLADSCPLVASVFSIAFQPLLAFLLVGFLLPRRGCFPHLSAYSLWTLLSFLFTRVPRLFLCVQGRHPQENRSVPQSSIQWPVGRRRVVASGPAHPLLSLATLYLKLAAVTLPCFFVVRDPMQLSSTPPTLSPTRHLDDATTPAAATPPPLAAHSPVAAGVPRQRRLRHLRHTTAPLRRCQRTRCHHRPQPYSTRVVCSGGRPPPAVPPRAAVVQLSPPPPPPPATSLPHPP